MQTSIHFKTKLFKPCKTLFRALKHPFKKPFFTQLFRFKKLQLRRPKRRVVSSVFRSFFLTGKMDEVEELRSIAETGREHMLFPSPITPAFMLSSDAGHGNIVEDACRSFENYLVEMIVEEGRVGDLIDVEELLYCWKNLSSPVFVDLVGRFYAELCNDLFSGSAVEVDDSSS